MSRYQKQSDTLTPVIITILHGTSNQSSAFTTNQRIFFLNFKLFNTSTFSRCSQIRPLDTAPDGPSLAAGAATHPIQTVRAHVSLPQRSSATILDRAGNARRQHCPSSPAVGVIYRSRCASYTSINNRRSGVHCCWPESMEQSTSCCPLLCHIQHLQKRP